MQAKPQKAGPSRSGKHSAKCTGTATTKANGICPLTRRPIIVRQSLSTQNPGGSDKARSLPTLSRNRSQIPRGSSSPMSNTPRVNFMDAGETSKELHLSFLALPEAVGSGNHHLLIQTTYCRINPERPLSAADPPGGFGESRHGVPGARITPPMGFPSIWPPPGENKCRCPNLALPGVVPGKRLVSRKYNRGHDFDHNHTVFYSHSTSKGPNSMAKARDSTEIPRELKFGAFQTNHTHFSPS